MVDSRLTAELPLDMEPPLDIEPAPQHGPPPRHRPAPRHGAATRHGATVRRHRPAIGAGLIVGRPVAGAVAARDARRSERPRGRALVSGSVPTLVTALHLRRLAACSAEHAPDDEPR